MDVIWLLLQAALKGLECGKLKPVFEISYLTAEKMFTLIILDVKSFSIRLHISLLD